MAKASLFFVRLEPKELEFLRALQRLVQSQSKLKKPPPLHRVMQGVLLDYRSIIEVASTPDFLRAYGAVKKKYRRKKKEKPAITL